MLDCSELNLYNIDREIRELCSNITIYSILGNINDNNLESRINKLSDKKIDFIFSYSCF